MSDIFTVTIYMFVYGAAVSFTVLLPLIVAAGYRWSVLLYLVVTQRRHDDKVYGLKVKISRVRRWHEYRGWDALPANKEAASAKPPA